MSNTLWHPASEQPRERAQPLLLATKTTWRDKDGKMLQGISPTAYFLGCYADGQFWDEIGERLPKDVTVTHWMAKSTRVNLTFSRKHTKRLSDSSLASLLCSYRHSRIGKKNR